MGAREDKARAELVDGITALAARRGTTPEGLFLLYDESSNGTLSRAELKHLLSDANVGNALTRSTWVSRIFVRLDKDSDGELSRAELDGVLKKVKPPAVIKHKMTQQEARALAKLDFETTDELDFSSFSNEEIAMIEDESILLAQQAEQGQRPRLTRAEAHAIADHIYRSARTKPPDLSAFDAAEIGLIEEESSKIALAAEAAKKKPTSSPRPSSEVRAISPALVVLGVLALVLVLRG